MPTRKTWRSFTKVADPLFSVRCWSALLQPVEKILWHILANTRAVRNNLLTATSAGGDRRFFGNTADHVYLLYKQTQFSVLPGDFFWYSVRRGKPQEVSGPELHA